LHVFFDLDVCLEELDIVLNSDDLALILSLETLLVDALALVVEEPVGVSDPSDTSQKHTKDHKQIIIIKAKEIIGPEPQQKLIELLQISSLKLVLPLGPI
jgi:hypothetical protein